MKIKSIHFFRGIAILFIIAGHCLGQGLDLTGITIEEQSIVNKLLYNFLTGGTGMFVFISGFLFYSVFYKKYNFKDFTIKKLKNIYIPYIVLSIYPIIKMYFIDKQYKFEYNLDILHSFYTGIYMTGYWYITFIMIMFLISPLFIKYINSEHKGKILLISFFISLIIQRPIQNLNQIHSVIYFTFFYILGIWVAINKDKVLEVLKNKVWILGILTIIVVILQTMVFVHMGNYHKEFFEFKGIDFILIQKTLMCLIFFVFLTRFENSKLIVLDKLAEYSFAIYFLHPYIMRVFENKIYKKIEGINYWALFLIEMSILVFVSIVVAMIIKKLLKKYSRYVIGY